jgi:hypothetical protein
LSTMTGTRQEAGIFRWGALAGVGYVVLFAIGTIMIFGNSPDSSSAPGKIVAYYSQSGHRDRMNIGWVLGALGILCFVCFLIALRQTVRRLEGEDGFLSGLVTVGGGIYATLALAALAVNSAIRTMSDDTYHHTVYPGLIHAADDTAWILHASGGVGTALMVIAASVAGMRAGAVSRWLGWVGVAAGILSVGLLLFFPWFIFALWMLVVSIGLFVRSGRMVAATAAA